MAIQRINRVKVDNFSQDLLNRANEKTDEGNDFLQKANNISPNGELLSRALNSFEEAIQFYPKIPEPYLGISWIFHITGDTKKAISFTLRALDIDPKNILALELLEKYEQNLNSVTISNTARKTLVKLSPEPLARTENNIIIKAGNINFKQQKVYVSQSFLNTYKK